MENSINQINLLNTNFGNIEKKTESITLLTKIEEIKPTKIISKKDNTISKEDTTVLKFDYDYEDKIFISIKEDGSGKILSAVPFIELIKLRNS